MADLQRQIDSVQISQVELDEIKERHENALDELNRLKGRFDDKAEERKIQELETSKRREDDLVGQLATKLKELSTQAESTNRISMKRDDLRKNEQQISKIAGDHRAEIEKHVGKSPKLADLEMSVQSSLKAHQQKIRETTASLEEKKLKANEIETQLRMHSGELERKQRELSDKTHKLDEVATHVMAEAHDTSSDRSIPALLERMNHQLLTSQRKVMLFEVVSDVYERYIQKAKEEHKCPLCERHFEEEDLLRDFLTTLEDTLQRVPESHQEAQNSREKQDELVARVQSVRPDWDSRELLQARDIPSLEGAIDVLRTRKEPLVRAIADLQQELERLTREDQAMTALLKQAERISSFLGENIRISREVGELDQTLASLSDSKSLDEVKGEYEAAQRNGAEFNRKINELRGVLNASRENLRTYEKKANELQFQHSLQEQKLGEKSRLLEKRSQLMKDNQELELRIPVTQFPSFYLSFYFPVDHECLCFRPSDPKWRKTRKRS